ncbi:MAG TPA: ATP-binding protein [Bryobacteraceae bacterium]|jgi:two-component system phosphate regulon sensor histidine kinase PhoR|nr:ATP-binding protein [Bryobacteraceae bacterium]
MRDVRAKKLLGVWCLLMLFWPLTIIWIRADFLSGNITAAVIKLGIVLGAVAAASLLFTWFLARHWALPTRRFEDFIAALPTSETDLPVEGPPELQSLSRAMKAMAQRVRQVVEQANLEGARRETILACMAEGVLAVRSDLKVVFCNDAFARAFSTRVPVSEGRTLYEVVREPEIRNMLERVLTSASAATARFRLPSAAGRWFEARALPLGQTPVRGAVIVLHDVTDIQRQQQLRKDFVANVSHELRTPLAAIRGYAETLLDGALEDPNHNRKFVEVILSHAVRLNNIASDLLILSELDSDAPFIGPAEPVAVCDIIDSVVRTVEAAAQERDVRIESGVTGECFIQGHRYRLEQVLINLVDNAVKFNKPGGRVRVQCSLGSDGLLQIAVSDTGIGIASEDLKRVFERFYRVDRSRSRTAGGTGLGLPIVNEIVSRMGGSVRVESQLGRGSTFIVSLPAYDAVPATVS